MALKQIRLVMATLAANSLFLSHALQSNSNALIMLKYSEEANTAGANGQKLSLIPSDVPNYLAYLDNLFTAALRMMLPGNKDTIGGHCFRYAALMAREFYATPGGPPDLLGVGGIPAIADSFNRAAGGQRVALGPFIDAHKELAGNEEGAAYGAFLAAVFDAGTAMMLPSQKMDLGQHCYGYAHIFAQEFYFGGNNGQDLLGLQAPLPPAKAGTPFANVHAFVNNDFASVEKDSNGRVTRDAFKKYFLYFVSQALQ